MAVFNITDKTETIEAVCFPKNYPANKELLAENAVLFFKGRIKFEEDFVGSANDDDEDEEKEPNVIKKFTLDTASILHRDAKRLVIEGRFPTDWKEEILPKIGGYITEGGHGLYYKDRATGQIRNTGLTVDYSIVGSGFTVIEI